MARAACLCTYHRPLPPCCPHPRYTTVFVINHDQEKITELPEADELDPHAMYNEADNEIWELVQRKLANPDAKLTEEESLDMLTYGIDMGETAASQADDQDIVMVVGNTGGSGYRYITNPQNSTSLRSTSLLGAGKSTFINILHGCSMKQCYKPGTPHKVRRASATSIICAYTGMY